MNIYQYKMCVVTDSQSGNLLQKEDIVGVDVVYTFNRKLVNA